MIQCDSIMKNIFVAGSIAYDEIMDFPHHFKDYFHPEKLHQINVSFVVNDLAKHLGGIAINISYGLKNTIDYYPLAISRHIRISPVATVGKDGGQFFEFFKKNNIDTAYVRQDKKLYTATGKVITDKTDNQIWGFYYGASALNPRLSTLDPRPHALPPKRDLDFWIVSATHEKPFTSILQYVIKNKLPYLFDPGMALTWIDDKLLKEGVTNALYVVGNDYEIAMIEKRLKMTVKEIVGSGVNVITTLGEKGVVYYGIGVKTGIQNKKNGDILSVPAVKLKKVIDPTGAGDAWRGGFTGALAADRPLKECLAMGNVMASFAVESVGTVEYKAGNSKIKKRMKSIINV